MTDRSKKRLTIILSLVAAVVWAIPIFRYVYLPWRVAQNSPIMDRDIPFSSTVMKAPGPDGMIEWVDVPDIIIEGTILDREFVGYGSYIGAELVISSMTSATNLSFITQTMMIDGELQPVRTIDTPGFPYYDYTVRVDAIYKNDGDLEIDDTIIVRESPAYINLVDVGESFLYALTKEPDHLAYGLVFNVASRLDVSGENVQYSTDPPFDVTFTDNVSVDLFVLELQSLIGQ